MTEIIKTNFVHDQERREETIAPDAPYTLFEPAVEGMNRNEVLEEVKDWATQIGVEAPYVTPLGGGVVHTLGKVAEDRGSALLQEAAGSIPPPESMLGVLSTIAQLAERSGFDREKAEFHGSFMFNDPADDPNLNVHSDGLSGIVKEGTGSAQTVRFVYALGPGSLLYPRIREPGQPIEIDYDSQTNTRYIESPSELESINAPKGAAFTDQELIDGDAQQVVPGVILGFDPTQTFWHQAPDESRPILVVDIKQVS